MQMPPPPRVMKDADFFARARGVVDPSLVHNSLNLLTKNRYMTPLVNAPQGHDFVYALWSALRNSVKTRNRAQVVRELGAAITEEVFHRRVNEAEIVNINYPH